MTIGLAGCASLDDEPDEEKPAAERPIGQAPTKESNIPTPNLPNGPRNSSSEPAEDGKIKVKRYGPGYEVEMNIDASDENIAFLMDLPQQKQIDKLKKNIYASQKLLMDAQALFYKKDYNKALATIDNAIDAAADNPLAHALRGSILFKLQKTQDAVFSWQRALELDPTLTDIKATLKKLGIKE
ncbi:MAG: tetratricopeptide repeat protein [Legionellales bacterium]|nr:tetratricopeptide repeat protein [Legionellales bacterium]